MLGQTLRKLTETLENTHRRTGAPLGKPPAPPAPAPARDAADFAAFLQLQRQKADAVRHRKLRQNVEQIISVPSICEFIETDCVDAESVSVFKGAYDFRKAVGIKLEAHQRRILTHVLTINPQTGRFPYMTVCYSAPKKEGKTGISAFVGAWYAKYINHPTSVMVLANDRDQAHERAIKAMTPTLVRQGAIVKGDSLLLPNGSSVNALTNQPESEAGGHYGATFWTELWAYDSARSLKLWAEMMPISTQPLSLRWVDSYAGYEDKSALLLSLFLEIFTDTTESTLQNAARAVPELADITTTDSNGSQIPCCYEVPSKGLFYYVDHEHRMPWSKQEGYFEKETLGLTKTDVTRLYFNRWQKSENPFVSELELNASFRRGVDLPRAKKMVFGLDGSIRVAHSAIVGVFAEETDNGIIYRTGFSKSFDPRGETIDLEDTLGEEVVTMWKAGLILPRTPDPKEKELVEHEGYHCLEVHFDNFQMIQVALNLKKKHKILLKEFNQKAERERSDTFLQLCYQNGTIDNPDDEALRAHFTAASAESTTSKQDDQRVRIVQNSTSPNPVDLCVAQSMAVYRLSQRPMQRRRFGAIGFGRAKGLK